MLKSHKKICISVKTEYYFIAALALLQIPFKWIVAWFFASVFHELCHFTGLRLCGCRVFRILVGVNGTLMDTDLCDDTKEILSALSGPVGSFALIFAGSWFPRLAVCGLFQCAYNLIPIYPLDGGRAFRSCLHKLFSEKTSRQIEIWVENSVLILFLLLGMYCVLCLKLGLIPLLFAGILIIKNKWGKCTCKEQPLGVK